ncbi:UNVERIFIED_CONTAM: hypothetical protein Sradi_3798500 [Sesamum radiatum]|uniref:Uncharacterized protein n=1 Tax=Sesamum radiatum TaxID=300843 RepID=A0AAW2Q0L9_SESRA
MGSGHQQLTLIASQRPSELAASNLASSRSASQQPATWRAHNRQASSQRPSELTIGEPAASGLVS